ncbi:MAG: hypothetical protein GY854_13035 [Deltaproteobacteria bacterium]|nr:hypothetical protein [Deltaproteobacteria bacterium]
MFYNCKQIQASIRRSLLLGASVWLVFLPTAAGQDLTASGAIAPEEPVRVVMIAEHGAKTDTQDVIQAVEGQLSDLHAVFEVEWRENFADDLPAQVELAGEIAQRVDAVTVFWCDFNRPNEVYLYLSDAGDGRVLVRQLDTAQEGDRFETLALIVHSAVSAMLRGGKIDVAVSSPPEKKTEPPKEKKPAPRQDIQTKKKVHLELEIGYALGGHSSRKPLIHGLDVGLSIVFARGLFVFAGYTFRGPIKINALGIAIDIQNHPIHLGLGYRWTLQRLSLSGALALTGDFVSQETRAVATDTAESIDNNDFLFYISPLVTAALSVVGRVAIFLTIGADFSMNDVRYISTESGQKETIDEPFRVAPRGIVGLLFII